MPTVDSACPARVSCFVDGFNLYHSIDDLGRPHLKWLNLWRIAERFVSPKSEKLTAVYYFSAFADWMPKQRARHEAYVRALEAIGVRVEMSQFKKKDRECPRCGHKWLSHEEKETDVNIGVTMLYETLRNSFDKALLITRDSDLNPAVRILKKGFPNKKVFLVAPPHRGHSTELLKVVDGKYKITIPHLEGSLFGGTVQDPTGRIVAERPSAYDPPR